MLRTLFLAVSLFLSHLGSAQESRGLKIVTQTPEGEKKVLELYRKSYAVIIGIDQYKNFSYDQQLSYAVRDAKGIEETLKQQFKFDKLITLYNTEATRESILKVLAGDLISNLGEEDALLVFWAGHGYTQKTKFGDLGYLIPHDGTFNETELYKNISMETIKNEVSKRIPAKHIFFVIDACYSGLLLDTRGAERQTKRDIAYLTKIATEEVRQVLTAGDEKQTVLDGGPRGHSVFTGRFLEALENTEDFITASEIAALVKEKVFSDARARGHEQTPRSGELYGTGDYVFIPSLEQKVETIESQIVNYEQELKTLEIREKEAARLQDEREKRQIELEKQAIQAKLKAEQLQQERLTEEQKRREQEDVERLRREQQLTQEKQTLDANLDSLKMAVVAKRKTMEGSTLLSLSPTAKAQEMKQIDAKIKEIKNAYRNELAEAIKTVSQEVNNIFVAVQQAKKDEFESETEFRQRSAHMKSEAEQEQTRRFIEVSQKIETAYNNEVPPFIESLKQLSSQEFTLIAQDLVLELRPYNPTFNTYPITIRTKEPIDGIQVACSADIPISREEARVLKEHFDNNILRAELVGNFQTTEFFRVASAYVIDDATNKKYDLFTSKFVDLGNEIIYDSVTKILWLKDSQLIMKKWGTKEGGQWDVAKRACENLNFQGLLGWRLPTRNELIRMYTPWHSEEPNPFYSMWSHNWTCEEDITDRRYAWRVNLRDRSVDKYNKSYEWNAWCVRGGR